MLDFYDNLTFPSTLLESEPEPGQMKSHFYGQFRETTACTSPLIDFYNFSFIFYSKNVERRFFWSRCWGFSTFSLRSVPAKTIRTRQHMKVNMRMCVRICEPFYYEKLFFITFQSFLHSQHRSR